MQWLVGRNPTGWQLNINTNFSRVIEMFILYLFLIKDTLYFLFMLLQHLKSSFRSSIVSLML